MIKIKTGFLENQYHIINDNEAHKAYYLFNNPETRTTFSNGVALTGKTIQGIEPAWNETMGWNPTHRLDDDDWNEIRKSGKDIELRNLLSNAQEIAKLAENKLELLGKLLEECKPLLLK